MFIKHSTEEIAQEMKPKVIYMIESNIPLRTEEGILLSHLYRYKRHELESLIFKYEEGRISLEDVFKGFYIYYKHAIINGNVGNYVGTYLEWIDGWFTDWIKDNYENIYDPELPLDLNKYSMDESVQNEYKEAITNSVQEVTLKRLNELKMKALNSLDTAEMAKVLRNAYL